MCDFQQFPEVRPLNPAEFEIIRNAGLNPAEWSSLFGTIDECLIVLQNRERPYFYAVVKAGNR